MYHIYVSFKTTVDRKIRFGGSLSAKKCYPYKAWPWNLSAISPARNQERVRATFLAYISLLEVKKLHERDNVFSFTVPIS